MKLYIRVPTKQFRKDLKRLKKSGYDLAKLEYVIDILMTGESLPDNYRDHELRGNLHNSRECHIGPDWLLRYAKDDDVLVLMLISTGSHRRVLGIE